MKVFVTGATGLVGSHVVPRLTAAGHSVTALARSAESIAKLEAGKNIKGVKGTITDLEICGEAAKNADAVIHLAFDHQQAFAGDFVGACEKDRAVIKAMCDGLEQSTSTHKVIIISSGTLGIVGSDETAQPHRAPQMPRYQSTELAFSYVPKGLRAVELRLAPITYGTDYPHDFIRGPLAKFKQSGTILYPAGGVWPACSVSDAADLYVKALENDKLANPSVLHGIEEEGVPQSKVAEVLGRRLGLSVKEIDGQEFVKEVGPVGMFATMVKPVTSKITQQQINWKPKSKGLLAQLEEYTL